MNASDGEPSLAEVDDDDAKNVTFFTDVAYTTSRDRLVNARAVADGGLPIVDTINTSFEDSVIENLTKIRQDLLDIRNHDDAKEPAYVIHAIAARMDEFSSVLRHLHATKLHEKVNVVSARIEKLSATIAYLHNSMQSLLDENSDLRHRQLQKDNSLFEVRKNMAHISETQDRILAMLLEKPSSHQDSFFTIPAAAQYTPSTFMQSPSWSFSAPPEFIAQELPQQPKLEPILSDVD